MPFDVIYADCPWEFQSGGARGGRFGDLDYPSMSVAELKAIPVKRLANQSSALFSWAVGSMIPECIEVAAAWGFNNFIRVDKVWAKRKPTGGRHAVVGPWGMTDAEYLLLFVNGKMCGKQAARNQFTMQWEDDTEVLEADYPGRHSKKPEIFRQLIEQRFPDLARCELFCREKKQGWTVLGNDIDGKDIRDAILSLPPVNIDDLL